MRGFGETKTRLLRSLSKQGVATIIVAPATNRRTQMGELTDKAKAAGNKAAGSIKEAVGKATDNEELEAEGKAQQVKGSAQDVSGTVKGKLGDDV
ncbi:CsbD family protein [Loktanella sp. TSTF-M6]|uniref:CsbD family protein n=2 Tax=Loktanella TaxID=245186 RepID=A0ABS8BUI5_9RHOB|nr:CsbD family protein [Loktanella gaetbuli]MCB5199375.1 CsbD family protein [Loktanella gaetbuli]